MAQKKTFVLRLSPEMFAELERWSAQEFRSVNGQIEFVLCNALKQYTGNLKKNTKKQ